MMLSENTNAWGIPTKPKPVIEKKVEPPREEPCTVLEDLHLTLRFLSEVSEPELTPEQKKEKLLEDAGRDWNNFLNRREQFCAEMENLGVSRKEAMSLWITADT